jgi:GT2 family glycosyltransferase
LASRGKFIALLNNDTEAHPEWLKELVLAAHSNPQVGMFASKTLFFDRRDIIDTTGHLMYPDGLNRGRGRLEVDRGQYDNKVDVFFPSGCAAFYRREIFDDIGLFDENHFAYGDDTDIGLRARLAGWGCIFVPKAIVYHKYSMTTGEYSPEKVFLVERNRIWIVWKYFPEKMIVLSFFYSLLRYILQGYGALLKKGAAGRFANRYSTGKLVWIVLKAYFSALKGLPRVIKERRRMRKLWRVRRSEIDRWFRDYRMSLLEISLKP